MLVNCCQMDYDKDRLKCLFKEVILNGNIEALSEVNRFVADMPNGGRTLAPLDDLILFYLDTVWMPQDLKENFQAIRAYLNYREAAIFERIALYGIDDVLNTQEYSDIYSNIIIDTAKEVVFYHTNGKFGEIPEKRFNFKYWLDMVRNNYTQIQDDVLILLFLGYRNYLDQMFTSNLERDLFKTFIFNRKFLLNISEEDSIVLSIEDKLIEMEF